MNRDKEFVYNAAIRLAKEHAGGLAHGPMANQFKILADELVSENRLVLNDGNLFLPLAYYNDDSHDSDHRENVWYCYLTGKEDFLPKFLKRDENLSGLTDREIMEHMFNDTPSVKADYDNWILKNSEKLNYNQNLVWDPTLFS